VSAVSSPFTPAPELPSVTNHEREHSCGSLKREALHGLSEENEGSRYITPQNVVNRQQFTQHPSKHRNMTVRASCAYSVAFRRPFEAYGQSPARGRNYPAERGPFLILMFYLSSSGRPLSPTCLSTIAQSANRRRNVQRRGDKLNVDPFPVPLSSSESQQFLPDFRWMGLCSKSDTSFVE